MLGAIIGDIVGSRFEFKNHRSKDFQLFHPDCSFTDDTICTVAVADAIMCNSSIKESLLAWCNKYPNPKGGYGGSFSAWINRRFDGPYNSFGNGSAMRVSPCGWLAKTAADAKLYANTSAICTHNHPEGIKGAETIAYLIFRLRCNWGREAIRSVAMNNGYDVDIDLETLRLCNTFDETCQVTVPQAIACFLQSTDFEDCIRNAVYIGGDTDTIAAIAGSLAEACYGIPDKFKEQAMFYLPTDMKAVIERFYSRIHTQDGRIRRTEAEGA